ncbi:MAG TPA: hypothetical protein VF800_26870 [Telluria sp.]|jgi:hypothetical protein
MNKRAGALSKKATVLNVYFGQVNEKVRRWLRKGAIAVDTEANIQHGHARSFSVTGIGRPCLYCLAGIVGAHDGTMLCIDGKQTNDFIRREKP